MTSDKISSRLLIDCEKSDYLVDRAGITSEIIAKGSKDQDFEEVLTAMSLIHQGKEVLYGSYMETHGSDPDNFALMEHYADTKRKFVRATNFIKRQVDKGDLDIKELLDTYMDLAVYGAMGVQLVLHLMERKRDSSQDNSGGRSGE